MHNLAIALHKKGYKVTGSDDQIFEPSRTRLMQHGLLPEQIGWIPRRIGKKTDTVIVGMHAKPDNPELIRSQELGLKVFSYPEFLYEQSKNKTRIVIGGSHGKTTITAMILHVMKYHKMDTDYMVGAQLDGFDVMVKISDSAPVMVMEGDEYPSSPTDLRPKFHLYKPHIAVISGIAWDHINVFKTFDVYTDQFRKFIHCIEKEGKLIFCDSDKLVRDVCNSEADESLSLYPYNMPDHEISEGKTFILSDDQRYPIRLFGKHNLLNMNAARIVVAQLGITEDMFYEAIKEFKGASKRLETLFDDGDTMMIRDFAHAPSKLKATVNAVKEQYPDKNLVACMELHTYSSLSEHFLSHYEGSMDLADKAFVFYNPHALMLKKLPMLDPDAVTKAFAKSGLRVITDKETLEKELNEINKRKSCFLMMSSGDFGGLDLNKWIRNRVYGNEEY